MITMGLTEESLRFQNNIQSIFQRVRLLYGATPLEDIIDYNFLVRQLTEWTGTQQFGPDNSSIAQGIGGIGPGMEGLGDPALVPPMTAFDPPRRGFVNIRQAYIHGYSGATNPPPTLAAWDADPSLAQKINLGNGLGTVPNQVGTAPNYIMKKRYQISLALGLFTQEKLIPTKFMASQLAIEIQLELPPGCMLLLNPGLNTITWPTYQVSNVVLIPEILEFDASYDASFIEGLRNGGVPIKLSSWHNYRSSTMGSTTFNITIQERNRSVKSIFAMQRRDPVNFYVDSHAALYATNQSGFGNNSVVSYQYRIGGRYFPASPVQCTSGNVSNGASEAYLELEKALNMVGDTRLSTSLNTRRWALPPATGALSFGGLPTPYAETDYATSVFGFNDLGQPKIAVTEVADSVFGSGFAGNLGSAAFCLATDLETSNGVEISGLNAEEQSDISLQITYLAPQENSFLFEIFTYFDMVLVLRENNVLEMIQ